MRNLFLSVVLLFISYYTFSQTLTGTISDSQSGESLFGATVYIINQQTGTRTDYDGNFKINLSKGVNRIEFRYIGYQNKLIELSINSDTSIVVSLESKTQELEGVTVTMTVDKGSTSEIIRMQNKSAVSLDGVTSEQFKYECWAIVQELDPEDIADAIGDSVALVEAIKANHAEDVASIVMKRVELKVRRRAELRVFDVVKTAWVDDIEELQAYRNLRIERVQKALDERKIMEAKMDGPFQQMFDE